MPSEARLRAVPPGIPGPRRRGPGPAVLLVALYALLFLGGLWSLRSKAPLSPKKGPEARLPSAEGEAPEPPRGGLSRAALLEATSLPHLARAEYFRRLSADCCPCGCDLNLRDCLLSDQTCVRSPQMANEIFRQLP